MRLTPPRGFHILLSAFLFTAVGIFLSAAPALAQAMDGYGPARAQVAGPGLLRMLLPILFIGILIYIMVRFFQRSGMGRGPRNPEDRNMTRDERHERDREVFRKRYSDSDDPENMKDAYARARASWDWLSQGGPRDGKDGQDTEAGPAMPVPDTPAGFDVQEFVAGAKAAYVRIRQALAENEAEEALDFAEQSALDQVAAMAEGKELPSEFLLVNARLMDTATVEGKTTATVFYDSLARSASAEEAVQLREVWTFQRDDAANASNWKLVSAEPMDQDAPAS